MYTEDLVIQRACAQSVRVHVQITSSQCMIHTVRRACHRNFGPCIFGPGGPIIFMKIMVRPDQQYRENWSGPEKSCPIDRECSPAMLFSFCTSALQ